MVRSRCQKIHKTPGKPFWKPWVGGPHYQTCTLVPVMFCNSATCDDVGLCDWCKIFGFQLADWKNMKQPVLQMQFRFLISWGPQFLGLGPWRVGFSSFFLRKNDLFQGACWKFSGISGSERTGNSRILWGTWFEIHRISDRDGGFKSFLFLRGNDPIRREYSSNGWWKTIN